MSLRNILKIDFQKTKSGVDNAVSTFTNSVTEVARQTLPILKYRKIKKQGRLKRDGMTNLVLI